MRATEKKRKGRMKWRGTLMKRSSAIRPFRVSVSRVFSVPAFPDGSFLAMPAEGLVTR